MNKVTTSKAEFYHRKIFSKMPVRFLKVNRQKVNDKVKQQTEVTETNFDDFTEVDACQNPVNTLT